MKKLLFLIFTTIFLNANSNVATKDDIKMLIYHMDKSFEQVDKRFEQVDKRFEQVDKRFELMEKEIDRRFEESNKKFEQVDKRFEESNRRFEAMQKQLDRRFEESNRRFDAMQRQIDRNFQITIGIMVTLFSVMMGYLLKERSSISNNIKEEIKPELLKKADKSTLEKVIAIIEDYAKKDEDLREMLSRHHLKYTA